MDIRGRGAVVVGGASGMGRASAELLRARGAEVAVLDRDADAGRRVAAALDGVFVPCDVRDSAEVERALEQAREALGHIHIAVNTAGGGLAKRVLSKDGPHPLEEFRAVVELNLVATFDLNRLQAWHMADNEPDEGERGIIINTASIAAFEGQIGQVAYAAAKSGIVGMTLAMARDLGSRGIRCVTIAPSLFATGATADLDPTTVAELTEDAAFPRRMGRPEEYARLVVAIVENPMLNGSCIRLDGGQRLPPR